MRRSKDAPAAVNAKADKDSVKRQRDAIERHAKVAGMTITEWFDDPAVSGADPIESRPSAMCASSRRTATISRTHRTPRAR